MLHTEFVDNLNNKMKVVWSLLLSVKIWKGKNLLELFLTGYKCIDVLFKVALCNIKAPKERIDVRYYSLTYFYEMYEILFLMFLIMNTINLCPVFPYNKPKISSSTGKKLSLLLSVFYINSNTLLEVLFIFIFKYWI